MISNIKHNIVGAALCILSISVLVSFSQTDTTRINSEVENVGLSLVQKELKKKLEKFSNTILEKCRMEAIEDAEIFVDSLVSEELNSLSGDTIAFPRKPVRPTLPQKVILNDSTDIDPIF